MFVRSLARYLSAGATNAAKSQRIAMGASAVGVGAAAAGLAGYTECLKVDIDDATAKKLLAALSGVNSRPAIYLVGGPSGAGKDTLLLGARDACAEQGEPVTFIVRQVTRPAELCTELETSVTKADFETAAAAGEHALSWSAHESVQYAIPRAALEAALTATPPQRIVLNVSRSILDEVLRDYSARADVYVLLMSASADALRARLRARGREDEAAIEKRVAKATAYKAPHSGHKVVTVLNDDTVEAGVAKVREALLRPCVDAERAA